MFESPTCFLIGPCLVFKQKFFEPKQRIVASATWAGLVIVVESLLAAEVVFPERSGAIRLLDGEAQPSRRGEADHGGGLPQPA